MQQLKKINCAICCETIETKPELNALFVTNSENTYFPFNLLSLEEQCFSEILYLLKNRLRHVTFSLSNKMVTCHCSTPNATPKNKICPFFVTN